CGPPGSGKSTWVKQHATVQDPVICLDQCKVAMGGTEWDNDPHILQLALQLRDQQLRALCTKRGGHAYVITTAPTIQEREAWRKAFATWPGHGEVMIFNTASDICIDRMRAEPKRRKSLQALITACLRWHRLFSSTRRSDVIVTGPDGKGGIGKNSSAQSAT